MTGTLSFVVNGRPVSLGIDGTTPLLSVLRDDLDLRGSKFGCGTEQCGACMVLIDGKPEYSCSREAATVEGKTITTVEGLSGTGGLHPLQQALLDEQAGQCGYCLSGIIVAAAALLQSKPNPSDREIRSALDGHLCRCGAHERIVRAIRRATQQMQTSTTRGAA